MSDCISQIDISLYIDDELSPGKRRALEKHISICPDCREMLKEFQNASRLFDSLKSIEPLDDLKESILSDPKKIKEGCVDERQLSIFLDGELLPKVSRAIKSHLTRCEDCKIKLDVLKHVSILCKTLDSEIPSIEMDRSIIASAQKIIGAMEQPAEKIVSSSVAHRGIVFREPVRRIAVVAVAAAIAGLVLMRSPVRITLNYYGGYKNQPVSLNRVDGIPVYHGAGVERVSEVYPVGSASQVVNALDGVLDSSKLLNNKVKLENKSVEMVLRFGDISYLSPDDQGRVISKDITNVFATLHSKFDIKNITIWIASGDSKVPLGVASFDRFGKPVERNWLSVHSEEFGKV